MGGLGSGRRRNYSVPEDASPFHLVTLSIRRHGRPEGWAQARDLLLDRYPVFARDMGAYQTLKAAMEADRHSMFAEVQAQASEGKFHREVWEEFQAFLKGTIAEPPAIQGATPRVGHVDAPEAMEDEPTEEEEI